VIDGLAEHLRVAPGPCFGEERPIALDGDEIVIGDRRVAVSFVRDGHRLWARIAGATHLVEWRDAVDHLAAAAQGASSGEARALMPGVVVSVPVRLGDAVEAGDVLMVIESMKLETAVTAALTGTVTELRVAPGESFERDAVLAVVEGA